MCGRGLQVSKSLSVALHHFIDCHHFFLPVVHGLVGRLVFSAEFAKCRRRTFKGAMAEFPYFISNIPQRVRLLCLHYRQFATSLNQRIANND